MLVLMLNNILQKLCLQKQVCTDVALLTKGRGGSHLHEARVSYSHDILCKPRQPQYLHHKAKHSKVQKPQSVFKARENTFSANFASIPIL